MSDDLETPIDSAAKLQVPPSVWPFAVALLAGIVIVMVCEL